MVADLQAARALQHQQRFIRFLSWSILVLASFFTANLVWLLSEPHPTVMFTTSIDLSGTLIAIGSYVLVRRNRLAAAALLIAIGGSLYALATAMVQPLFPTAMALVTLLSISAVFDYLDNLRLRLLSGWAWISISLIVLAPYIHPLITARPPLDPLASAAAIVVAGVILLVLNQAHAWNRTLLMDAQAAQSQLEASQAGLETEVARRTVELQAALHNLEQRNQEQQRLLAENARKDQALRELSVPLLPITSDALVVPLVGKLDAERLATLQDRALHSLERNGVHHLVIDITGVPVIDETVARGLIEVVQAARLLGTRVLLVGIHPEVAQSLVALQFDSRQVTTTATLQQGLEQINKSFIPREREEI